MPSKNPYPRRLIVTICGECKHAVTINHEAVWQRRGATGIVHAECAVDPDARPVRLHAVTYRSSEQW